MISPAVPTSHRLRTECGLPNPPTEESLLSGTMPMRGLEPPRGSYGSGGMSEGVVRSGSPLRNPRRTTALIRFLSRAWIPAFLGTEWAPDSAFRQAQEATSATARAVLVSPLAGEWRGSARGVRGFDPAAGNPFRVESARFQGKDHCADLAFDRPHHCCDSPACLPIPGTHRSEVGRSRGRSKGLRLGNPAPGFRAFSRR